MKFSRRHLFFILYLLLGITNMSAQVSENISIHGFGNWAAGFSDNNNIFVFATEDGEYNNYYLALNLAAQPADKLSIFTQFCWERDKNEKKVHLDYVFAQYMLSSRLKFRVGNMKSPFGLYSEIYDVGTLRPFYLLPAGMYNSPGMFPQSYVGLGITGEFLISKNWEVSYDFVTGEIEFHEFIIETPSGFDPVTHQPIMQKENLQPIGREMAGVKISLNSPFSGLMFGFSILNFASYSIKNGETRQQGDEYKNVRQNLMSGFLEYQAEKITIRSEIYRINSVSKVAGGYFEASYMLNNNWQVAVDYDWFENKTESVLKRIFAKSMVKHKNVGLSLNYWFNPNFVCKAGFYRIDGNEFARPDMVHEAFFAGELKEKTNVMIIGTQFSF